jgi:hypothetical protein
MDLHKTCEKIPKQTASIQHLGPLTKGKMTTMRDYFRKKEKKKRKTNKQRTCTLSHKRTKYEVLKNEMLLSLRQEIVYALF